MNRLIFLFLVFCSSIQAQDCLPQLNLIPFQPQATKDSTDLKTKLLHIDSTVKTLYVDSAGTTFRKDYYRGGQLQRICEIEYILQTDTEFIENELGDITPIPVYGNWTDICIGIYKEYHWGGQVKTTGKFGKSGKEGEWIEYFTSGKIRRKCHFYEGRYYGSYIEYQTFEEEYGSDSTFVKCKGKFAIVEIIGFYNWKKRETIKVGQWEHFDYLGKLVRKENHEWTGKIIKQ